MKKQRLIARCRFFIQAVKNQVRKRIGHTNEEQVAKYSKMSIATNFKFAQKKSKDSAGAMIIIFLKKTMTDYQFGVDLFNFYNRIIHI